MQLEHAASTITICGICLVSEGTSSTSAVKRPALERCGGSRDIVMSSSAAKRAAEVDEEASPLLLLYSELKDSLAFGSISFAGNPHAPPAKFVCILPSVDVGHVVDMLTKTWKIPPPCAILSMCADSKETTGIVSQSSIANGRELLDSKMRLDLLLRCGHPIRLRHRIPSRPAPPVLFRPTPSIPSIPSCPYPVPFLSSPHPFPPHLMLSQARSCRCGAEDTRMGLFKWRRR